MLIKIIAMKDTGINSSGGTTPDTGTSSYGNQYQLLNQKEVKFLFDLTLGDYFRIPDNFNKIIELD